MENVKGKMGFGCMRLPMKDGEVDNAEFTIMVDEFLEAGFNYFDTAHLYLGGKSEIALRECLTSRYARDKYIFVNKLTGMYFQKEEDIEPFVEMQLKACGIEYFDYYLMHSQSEETFAKFKKCRAYEKSFELKKAGKFKHVGISFHDKASILEQILNEYPEIEVVQIQLNYVDFEDAVVEGRKCLEVCKKFNKPVIVMEPVKGGYLANLPDDAKAVYEKLNGGSPASYAMRFVGSLDDVEMILSGVSNIEQIRDNIKTMKDFKKLEEVEMKAVNEVCEILKSKKTIACTDCKYCVPECPKNILIPNLFGCLNSKKLLNDWNVGMYYNIHTTNNGKASDCIACKKCEKACPQHLEISSLLKEVSAEFDM